MWRGQRPGASSSTSMRIVSPGRAWRCATASAAAATRRKKQHVDADRVARARVPMRDRFDGRGDPAQPVGIDGGIEALARGPPLHLDERDRVAAPGDEIDLTARRLQPAGHDSPSLEPKEQRGEPFAAAAATFGNLAFHLARSSSARA